MQSHPPTRPSLTEGHKQSPTQKPLLSAALSTNSSIALSMTCALNRPPLVGPTCRAAPAPALLAARSVLADPQSASASDQLTCVHMVDYA